MLPEAQEAHEVLGNQEHQRYQEHPAERERERDRRFIGHLTIMYLDVDLEVNML